MRIKAKTSILTTSGRLQPGDEVELPETEGRHFVREGLAQALAPKVTWPQKLDSMLKKALVRKKRHEP